MFRVYMHITSESLLPVVQVLVASSLPLHLMLCIVVESIIKEFLKWCKNTLRSC